MCVILNGPILIVLTERKYMGNFLILLLLLIIVSFMIYTVERLKTSCIEPKENLKKEIAMKTYNDYFRTDKT